MQLHEQAIMAINEERRQQLEEQIAEVREKATNDVDYNAGEAEEDMENVHEKKKAYLVAQKTVLALKDMILELKSWVWIPPEMLNILAALGFMYGAKRESIFPKRKSVLKWDKLKTLLDGEFFTGIETVEVSGERKNLIPEQKLSA